MSEKYEPKIREMRKLNTVERGMAKAMAKSWATIPHMSMTMKVNANNLVKVKKEIEGVSYNDILIKLMANALTDYPKMNSTLTEDNQLIVYDDVNVSVAMSNGEALYVPVIKQVNEKSVHEVAGSIRAMAKKVSEGSITMDDMSYGTITTSNLGKYGMQTGTAIINYPQATLVYFGAILKEPIVDENDEIVVGNVINFLVMCDHRIIDGVTSAEFTAHIKNGIENLTVDMLK